MSARVRRRCSRNPSRSCRALLAHSSSRLVSSWLSSCSACGRFSRRQTVKDGAALEIELPLGAFAAGFDAVPAPRSEVVAGAFQPVLQVPEIGLINGQGIAQDRSWVGDCIPRGLGGQSGCWRQQSQTKAQDQGQQLRDQSARHGCPFSSGDHRTIRLYPFAGNDLQQRLPHWHHD